MKLGRATSKSDRSSDIDKSAMGHLLSLVDQSSVLQEERAQLWDEIMRKAESTNELTEQLLACKMELASFEGARKVQLNQMNAKDMQICELQDQVETLTRNQGDSEKLVKTVQA